MLKDFFKMGTKVTQKVTKKNSLKPLDNRFWSPMVKAPLKKSIKNPGFHIIDGFISINDEIALLKETEDLKKKYSFIAGEPIKIYTKDIDKTQIDNKNQQGIEVLPRRVTGRLENNNSSPWGYGDTFQMDGVPQELKKLADHIQTSHEEFLGGPGKLRDITINYRDFGMFILDPHVDPASDGSFVFVVGLQSDVVFTLSPPSSPNIVTRTDPSQVAMQSWSDDDIDILLRKRGCVGLGCDARSVWRHGIRAGVDVPGHGVCDWFGSIDTLLLRGKERTSIVFAFQ